MQRLHRNKLSIPRFKEQIMQRYKKYKNSDIEWIGEIPEHWEVKKLKYVLNIGSGEGIKSEAIKDIGDFPVYGGNGIVGYATKHNNNDKVFIIGRVGAKCGNVRLVSGEKWISDNALYAYSKGNLDFIKYCLIYKDFNKLANKNAQPLITSTMIKEESTFYPPLYEQTVIANYLDLKTADIDQLITQKERLLSLYEEEKTAIINHAVTKGIDPKVKLKDSGVDWLGKIPEHWEVKKLKYFIFKAGSGITPRGGASVYQLKGIPLLRSQNIHFEGLRLDDVAYITHETHDEMSNSKVFSGDVLLNITGASIGRCYYVTDCLGEANVNQHVCILRPMSIISTKFLYFIIRSNLGQEQISFEQTGSGREGLNFEALKNFLIPSIEVDEQTAIVHHIETETICINAEINKTKKIIALQKEYRTALISEVVTGKIKVTEELK